MRVPAVNLTFWSMNSNLNVSSPLPCFATSTHPATPGGTLPNPVLDPNYHLGCANPPSAIWYIHRPSPISTIGFDSRYDSLQVKAETKNMRHGLYVLLGYTYARDFDNGFSDGLGTSSGVTYYPLPGTTNADWACLKSISTTISPPASFTTCPLERRRTFGSSWNGRVNAVLGDWQVN